MNRTPAPARRRYAKRMAPPQRRDQLLDATLELITEDGYGGLTMHAVARRADVTRPVVYELFSNRDELLTALLEREEQRMLTAVAASLPAAPPDTGADPAAMLGSAMQGFLQAVHDAPGTWRLVYLPEEGTPQSLRAHVEQARAVVRAQLTALLGWALEQHGLEEQVDLELLSHIAQAFIERAAILVLTQTERFPPERLTRFVTDLYAALGASHQD